MDPDKLDLTPLDPSSDGARWEALVQRTAARALAARRAVPAVSPLWLGLLSVGRPLLAVGALVAVLAWLPSLLRGGAPTPAPAPADDEAQLLYDWAAGAPTATALFTVPESSDGTR